LEHHGDGEDCADGVDDALARDIWCGSYKESISMAEYGRKANKG
jgi:hypothetical protein